MSTLAELTNQLNSELTILLNGLEQLDLDLPEDDPAREWLWRMAGATSTAQGIAAALLRKADPRRMEYGQQIERMEQAARLRYMRRLEEHQ